MGTKSRAVLECLRKNGKMNRLDLEMRLGMSQLARVINRMYGLGYIKNPLGISGMYEITQAGRVALGESLTIAKPVITKICNGTSKEIYNPKTDLLPRYGVARL